VKADEKHMSRALALARRATPAVHPNPRVGAVLVRGGRVVAAGYHSRYGGPHAEARVLSKAGPAARGGTLYVTLEPCSTSGKTPPCVEAIIAAGIRRVVIGTRDPNPRHRGRSRRLLEAAGIKVTEGILEERCRDLIRDFRVWVLRGRPYTVLKLAESLDGRIATREGDSRWISSPLSRRLVHSLRAASDAVIVGSGTARCDDPRLDVRLGRSHPGLIKVVVDSRAVLSPAARVFSTRGPVWVAVGGKAPAASIRRLERAGALVRVFPGPTGRVDLPALWGWLASRGVMRVLVEGGGTLAGSLVDAALVDEVHFFIAPILIGGDEAVGAVGGEGISRMAGARRLERLRVSRIGPDLYVRGRVASSRKKASLTRGGHRERRKAKSTAMTDD